MAEAGSKEAREKLRGELADHPFQFITGPLGEAWDWYVQSGISPLSPQHAIHKLSRYEKEKYPEGVQNREQMVSLFDDPEYARLSEEATSGVIDPSGGLLGTVRKVAPKVAARAYPAAIPPVYSHSNYKDLGGTLSYVKPEDFLEKVKGLKIDDVSKENIGDLKKMIKSGKELDPAIVEIENGIIVSHDGRHRANAAKQLGIKEFPVIVIEKGASKVGNYVWTGRGILGEAGTPKTPPFKDLVVQDPMIVQHNINPETLPRVERMGGIPAPSMAVTKVDNPLEGFGEVSLLGGPEMAKPSAKNPIWGADAYTARTPQIEVVPDAKSVELVKKRYGEKWTHDAESTASVILTGKDSSGNQIFTPSLKVKYLRSIGLGDRLPKKPKTLKNTKENWQENNRREREYKNELDKVWQWVSSAKFNAYAITNPVVRPAIWLEKQKNNLLREGGGFTERIFRGYTQMGNRRYAPATLENVVKEMKGGAGGENWSGQGLLRASVTEKFKSEAEVKKARGKIQKGSGYGTAKGNVDQLYANLEGEAGDYLRKWMGENTSYNSIEEFTGDLVRGKKPWNYVGGGPAGANKYERFLAEIPDSLKKHARELREEYQKMPTEYFEIKPQRGVALSEFKGAIVPENLPKHQLKILKDAGIKKIYKYSGFGEREELMKKFPELMFLAPPVVGAGLLADQEGVQ